MPKSLKPGDMIRITSFADKPADGSEPSGWSASPEGTPPEEEKVFVCMVMAVEPRILDVDDEHYDRLRERVFNQMGFINARKF